MSVLVSVIIPAYNEEKLIGSCLESLKNQDFGNGGYEVIVVDNNSTDRTVMVAKDFNVKIISEPRKGVSFAVRKGFAEAAGEIIATTDADTKVNPGWISNIYYTFSSNLETAIIGGKLIFYPGNLLSRMFKFCNKKNNIFKSRWYKAGY